MSAVAAAAARLLLSAMQQSIDIVAAGHTAANPQLRSPAGEWDTQTDGGTPYRYIDLAAHYYAGSANRRDLCMAPYTACKKVKVANARLPSVGFRS